MKLNTLLAELEKYELQGSHNLIINSIAEDSRKAQKGALFVAIKGIKQDGHDFIQKAIEKGAFAVVGERKPEKSWLDKITYIQVENSRIALGLLASRWYNNPAERLKVIGITGTDGKTTTASLIAHILNQSGKKAGLVTSVTARIGKKEYDTGFHVTNPEAIPLQKILALMVKKKCKFAVLEVTSHGLDQERVAGVKFDCGVLTNITHEHIDYHKTWEKYFEAKAKLFKRVKFAILNKDDNKVFRKLTKNLAKNIKVITYGIAAKNADFKALEIEATNFETKFTLASKSGQHKIKTKLVGKYNISNILAAVAVARAFRVSEKDVKDAVYSFKAPPGRLEKVENKKGFEIYIDFAHTPNSLESVLTLLKARLKKDARLISVFGCAGERDVKKRPLMGKISTDIADISVFTAEDPRSENVNEIIRQMEDGAKKALDKSEYFKVPERGQAISFAIQKLAKKGDVVVICGKAHEKSMAYNGTEYPWSDFEAVNMAFKGKAMKIYR